MKDEIKSIIDNQKRKQELVKESLKEFNKKENDYIVVSELLYNLIRISMNLSDAAELPEYSFVRTRSFLRSIAAIEVYKRDHEDKEITIEEIKNYVKLEHFEENYYKYKDKDLGDDSELNLYYESIPGISIKTAGNPYTENNIVAKEQYSIVSFYLIEIKNIK